MQELTKNKRGLQVFEKRLTKKMLCFTRPLQNRIFQQIRTFKS